MLANTLLLLAPVGALLAGDPAQKALREPLPALESRHATHVSLGDLDNDGDVDAYVSRSDGVQSSAPDAVFLNDGLGVFAELAGALPPLVGGSGQSLLEDVDGDGDLDVFALVEDAPWPQDDQVFLYLNDGSASFTDATSQMPLTGGANHLRAGDVDGDGDVDLWVARSAFDRLLINDGAGSFVQAPEFPTLSTNLAADLADMDGDGDLDGIAFSNTDVRMLVNDGTGVFTEVAAQVPAEVQGEYGWDTGFADLDGDGDADLWVARPDKCYFLANDGAANFTLFPGSTIEWEAFSDAAIEVADFDGDLALDVAVGFSFIGLNPDFAASPGVRLWAGDGTGAFSEVLGAFPGTRISANHLSSADVDGDGDLDVWSQRLLYLGAGDGSFGLGGSTLFFEEAGTRPVADVNGDGWLDIFAADGQLLLGNGTSSFEVAVGALPSNAAVFSHGGVFGDVDGDGDQDLLVMNQLNVEGPPGVDHGNQDNDLWINDGAGNFTDVTATQLPQFLFDTGVNVAAFLEDVDGDGDLDVLSAARADAFEAGGGMDLWKNDGAGFFTDAPFGESLHTVDEGGVLVEDFDGDGDVDVLVCEGNAPVAILVNDGTGSFAEAPGQLPGQAVGDWRTLFLDSGDVDGDGLRDITIGRRSISLSQEVFGIWLGDGAGTYVDSGHALQELLAYRLVDLDADGDLDLAAEGAWLENDGLGVFTPGAGASPYEVNSLSNVTFADFDLDGDLDALNINRLVAGTSQHLAWRSLPSLGKPLTMELYGPSAGAFVLMTSLGRLPFPVATSLGGLSIDPAQIIATTAGALDGDGVGGATFLAPSNPAFAGLTVWWQGVVGLPARFTNLEGSTLTVY